jgi:hypothetical protein
MSCPSAGQRCAIVLMTRFMAASAKGTRAKRDTAVVQPNLRTEGRSPLFTAAASAVWRTQSGKRKREALGCRSTFPDVTSRAQELM